MLEIAAKLRNKVVEITLHGVVCYSYNVIQCSLEPFILVYGSVQTWCPSPGTVLGH